MKISYVFSIKGLSQRQDKTRQCGDSVEVFLLSSTVVSSVRGCSRKLNFWNRNHVKGRTKVRKEKSYDK